MFTEIYAIEEECGDDYYGWFVYELYHTLEDAEAAMKELAEINKDINYRLATWQVK